MPRFRYFSFSIRTNSLIMDETDFDLNRSKGKFCHDELSLTALFRMITRMPVLENVICRFSCAIRVDWKCGSTCFK